MLPKRLFAIILGTALAAMGMPVARAQWVPTNGPNSGDISAIFVDSSSVIAVDWDNDVFRSTDLGNSWVHEGQGLPNPYIWAIYDGGDNLFAATESNGIYRTSKNRWLWVPCDSGIKGREILSITSLGSYMVAASYGGAGIYRSSDSGLSWLPSATGLSDSFVHAVITMGTSLYAGTDSGSFVSIDSGRSWMLIDSTLHKLSVQSITQNEGILFAGVWGGGVFRSSDSGKHWSA
ncbi:MAG TPA: hypothetical protein VFX22_04620, partial [Candidatus Kapabacteria bacterium]|nr:hypothetical protein [Candidatus Kapabacteria bacterium]